MADTSIIITYEGKNITKDISPFLLSFSFTDNSGGNSDDLTITLEDRHSLWLNDWTPSKGDKIQASIVSNNSSLPCGVFEADEISYSYPPHVLSIKAISTAITKKLSGEKHSRAWENTKLSTIAADFASKGSLSLFFDADDVNLERREQIKQSDLEFLKALCSDYDLNVKVSDGKLIVYSGGKYQQRPSAAELNAGNDNIISVKFTSKSAKIYRKAHVKYHHPVKNITFEADADDDDTEGTERTLEINEYAESNEDAELIAQKRLASANAKEISGSITLKGDTRFTAGINITLSGFGMFSGKYSVIKAVHNVTSSGYTTPLELQQGNASKKASKAAKKSKQSKGKTAPQMLYYTGDKYYHSES